MAGQGSNIAAGFPSDENVFRYEHVLVQVLLSSKRRPMAESFLF